MRRPDLDAQEAIADALAIEAVDLRCHPTQPSADALLRDQSPEIGALAIKLIKPIANNRARLSEDRPTARLPV